ncbi:CPBP family intramembrane glutamic endopeptidase [Lentilactobacillus parakefiri]|uniref:Abortive infection protein n=1 Tax=Lentilactobacillus parakefiri TaxID=152332 RepID=A0A224VKT6_9LACO|nr:CPBP family intramembrane glutamic endopeptidase [Lentilactobacillus parakefiri]KRL71208.1 abortive infection protein [Lentilactobacillus parakefiri DSM 10551]TDG91826.1 hypothetical protein C5L28_001231 [Lentilactobacillus parakefiri]GAW72810.1 abortive infection protein [Lentilactobacillus parakefiri]
MRTQNKLNRVNNPRKWIWMLIEFIVIEKVLENGILVPVILKLPYGNLTSNILYKGIEVFLVLALNAWLIKQKLYFSTNVSLKTTLFFLFGVGYISLFISSGPMKLLLPIILWTLLTAISEELLFRGVILGDLFKRLTHRHLTKRSVAIAIGLSSLLFSLQHLSNLVNQSLLDTVCQMIETFGMGILLAAVYVRTGSLITTIFTHFLLDFPILYLSQFSTNVSSAATVTGNISVIASVVVAMAYSCIGLIVIRSKLIDNQLPLLTGVSED